ncbi:beta-lactamase/transpeptidase-like protein [Nemania diffusa]|nr:beta-lactamase/transpeptidase-like protein [Nemania diffusa]
MDVVIEKLMKLGNTPGLSMLVLVEGEVVFQRGYGLASISANVPATSSTIYPIASITKGFVAAACGVLVAEGKLSWDTPISAFVPEFDPECDPNLGHEVTLVDILSHRTGLEDQPTLYSGPNGVPLFSDLTTLLSVINKMGGGIFRKNWSYNPLPYALVTKIIEKASGTTLAELLDSRIFQPLGMTSTSLVGFSVGTPNEHRVARPYASTASHDYIERKVPETAYGFPFDSSMGIQSSIEDMARWSKAMIASYLTISQKLNSVCPLPNNPGGIPAYCLGWFLHDGHFIFDDMFDFDGQIDLLEWPCTMPIVKGNEPPRKILYHSGIGNGFTSSIHIYPEQGDAVVVLGNSSYSGDAVDCISRLVTATICDQDLCIDELENNLKHYTDLETGRWQKVETELMMQLTLCTKGPIPATNALLGCYTNSERNLSIVIKHDRRTPSAGSRPFIDATVSFGNMTDLGVPLWRFCHNTLCFLPTEREYQEWGMSYMTDWGQYLLHISESLEEKRVLGLWWQFDPNEDAIWFRKGDARSCELLPT